MFPDNNLKGYECVITLNYHSTTKDFLPVVMTSRMFSLLSSLFGIPELIELL